MANERAKRRLARSNTAGACRGVDLAEAERARSDAVAERWRVERERPRWFRPAARRERAQALARAQAAIEELGQRVDRLIVEAYTSRPAADVWRDDAARGMIASEPW